MIILSRKKIVLFLENPKIMFGEFHPGEVRVLSDDVHKTPGAVYTTQGRCEINK
jgi:hypothetical protein